MCVEEKNISQSFENNNGKTQLTLIASIERFCYVDDMKKCTKYSPSKYRNISFYPGLHQGCTNI